MVRDLDSTRDPVFRNASVPHVGQLEAAACFTPECEMGITSTIRRSGNRRTRKGPNPDLIPDVTGALDLLAVRVAISWRHSTSFPQEIRVCSASLSVCLGD